MRSPFVPGLALSMLLLVLALPVRAANPPPVTRSFTNSTSIVAPSDDGPASPYPSSINVSGMPGVITKLVVRVRGMSHPYPDDWDLLLVTPAGQALMLMSDAGGSFSLNDVSLTFDDDFAAIPNTAQIVSGTYATANWGLTMDRLESPAPGGPYLVGLTNAIGTAPNGTWKLYVYDDALDSTGIIDDGWSLTLTSGEIPPALTITRAGQAIQISWPATATGYSLVGNSHLSETPAWSAVTNTPAITNGLKRVTIPPSQADSVGFFRLEK